MEKLLSLNKDKIVQFVINNRSNELSMQNAYPRITSDINCNNNNAKRYLQNQEVCSVSFGSQYI